MSREAGDGPRSRSGLPRTAVPFAGARRDADPSQEGAEGKPGFAPGEGLELHRLMALSRAAEAQLAALADQGRIRRAPDRRPGREAGPVASAFALRRSHDGTGDVFAPTFRAAGALELFGIDLEAFFRGYLAGEIGPSRDTGAELHRVDLEKGLLAPVVPLGLLVEVVGGIALGAAMQGQDRVGLVCDTEGATSTGAWHEGLVVAAARRSPMVLVVEASGDSERSRKHTRVARYVEKAPGYGVGVEGVDGGDALAVTGAVRRAIARARAGKGVQMLEIRYGSADPIEVLRERLLQAGAASADDLAQTETEVREACRAAVEAVEAAGLADLPNTLDPVYAGADRIPRRIWAGPAPQKAV